MNRIILIGNGFDLAHGLKTSYKDFIADFLSSKGEEIKKNKKGHDCEFFKIDCSLYSTYSDLRSYEDFAQIFKYDSNKWEIKNNFFWNIIKKDSLENWVDIENEYYHSLKKITKKKKDDSKDDSKSELNSLHNEFKQIKELLKEYLLKIEKSFNETTDSKIIARFKNNVKQLIERPFVLRDLDNNSLMTLARHIDDMLKNQKTYIVNLRIDQKYIINEIEGDSSPDKIFNIFNDEFIETIIKLKPENILLLNFNYTDTHLLYTSKSEYGANSFQNMQSIKIHGCLYESNKNPIIFGFGDELDKDYQTIEDLDENDYLENIKSIKYLETDNYRKLLEFAESDQYQIYIFGHSCGNSDRTLLNTLFEHENCVSIKPFYHKKEDGTDNYSEIVRNISRNFKSKAKMRERVVNKTYSSPIPKRVN
jgi:hypothetical protein